MSKNELMELAKEMAFEAFQGKSEDVLIERFFKILVRVDSENRAKHKAKYSRKTNNNGM